MPFASSHRVWNKRPNIYYHLLEREYFSEKKSNRYSLKILRQLIVKGDYSLQKTWSMSSSQRICSDGILLFLKNYSQCIDCLASKPHCKFRVQKSSPAKIEDALIMDGMPETFELSLKGYKRGMLAVTKDNYLLRIDIDTGQVLEKVYVSPTAISFRTLQWNTTGKSVALISNLFPKPSAQPSRQNSGDKVKQLVVMSLYPLKFECMFSISRKVFGRTAADVSIFLDLVIVMYTSGHVRMYSLTEMLDKHRTHSRQLYESQEDGTKYGVYPAHLTENIDLCEAPPCLFDVRCRDRDVMLTHPPCYYVMWPHKDVTGYCCFSFDTGQMVENGRVTSPTDECTYDDRVTLHNDDSGRIVHMTNSEFRMLKVIHNKQTQQPRLVVDFTISGEVEFKEILPPPSLQVSRSGRILKKTKVPDTVNLPDRTILTMAYSEDQDMIVLLTIQQADQATIGFYDNWSGKLLRQFILDEPVEEALERSLCFYLDTLVHIFRREAGHFHCQVYKLKPQLGFRDELMSPT